jgi:hypothetical protein
MLRMGDAWKGELKNPIKGVSYLASKIKVLYKSIF